MTDHPGLGRLLKRGTALSAVGVVIVQGIGVAQVLILGRLLGPAEVGIFTAGTLLMGFVAVIAQGALSQALIQRRDDLGDLEDAANTVLVVTFGTGLLLSLAVLAAAPLFGMVFHSDRVAQVAAASSGMMLLHACTSVPDALMQRAFRFERRLIIDPAAALTFAAVATVFAILDFGAWAMVVGTYASLLVWVTLSWWLAGWRPFRGRFSLRIWREMAVFSFPLLVDGVAERSREVIEQLIVGRMLSTALLGQFRYGFRIASMPSTATIQVCSYVLFPAFARIADDPWRFRQAYLRALGWIWFAALPLGLLMLLFAEPVVVLALGEQWRAAGAVAAAMAGMGPGLALSAVACEALKGAGRSQPLTALALAGLVLGVTLTALLLIPLGLVGVGLAVSLSNLVIGVLSLVAAGPVVGVGWRLTVSCLAPMSAAAAIAFAAALLVRQMITGAMSAGVLTDLTVLMTGTVIFAVAYLIALNWLAPAYSAAIRQATGAGWLRLSRAGRSSDLPE